MFLITVIWTKRLGNVNFCFRRVQDQKTFTVGSEVKQESKENEVGTYVDQNLFGVFAFFFTFITYWFNLIQVQSLNSEIQRKTNEFQFKTVTRRGRVVVRVKRLKGFSSSEDQEFNATLIVSKKGSKAIPFQEQRERDHPSTTVPKALVTLLSDLIVLRCGIWCKCT